MSTNIKAHNYRPGKVGDEVQTVKYRFESRTGMMVMQHKIDLYLKGPIPISWISRVASYPGKALNVALAIRWLSDMNKNKPFKLTRRAMEQFCFSIDAAAAALSHMEKDGLILVHRRPGQRPSIQLLTSTSVS
jgi:hypothetical protein